MSLSFEPLVSSEVQVLAQFLQASFASPAINSFRPDVLSWKYFSEHPDWKGTRSFVVRQGGKVVAHGGVWPVRLLTPDGERRGIHLVDWAASNAAPGAGVFLLRKIAGLTDLLLTVGGSKDTQQILPKLGYRQVGEMQILARVVRPWRQFRTSPAHNWKAPLRLLRNAMWSWPPLPPPPANWKIMKVNQFNSSLDDLIRSAPPVYISGGRSAALLNHMLACPAAKFFGALLFQSDQLQGYFLVSEVGGQARIADLWIASELPSARRAAWLLAARSAAENSVICEIEASSCMKWVSDCCRDLGFRSRRTDPVYCYDPRKAVPAGPRWNVTLLDGDLCFLNDPAFPYLT